MARTTPLPSRYSTHPNYSKLLELRHRPLPSSLSLDYLCIDHSCMLSVRFDEGMSVLDSFRADTLWPFIFGQARRRNSALIVRLVVRYRRGVLGLLDRYSVEKITFWPCHCIFITTMVHEHLSCLCSVLVPFPLSKKTLYTLWLHGNLFPIQHSPRLALLPINYIWFATLDV